MTRRPLGSLLRSRGAVLVITCAIVVAAGAVTGGAWLRRQPPPLPMYGLVPDFSLVERSGHIATRADLAGKVSIVDFFYTRCPDVCPLQSAHMARLQTELTGAPDARLVSITVDPDHDRPAVLAAYAARFQADPTRWLFLTGPRDAVYRLAVDGFHLAAVVSGALRPTPWWPGLGPAQAWAHEEPAGSKVIQLVHASYFALVDRQAHIRGYFEGTRWDDVQRLQKDAKRLLAQR